MVGRSKLAWCAAADACCPIHTHTHCAYIHLAPLPLLPPCPCNTRAAMRAADPGAKAVVFSSWGRLLRLVGDALTANGLPHASLAGASPAQRQVRQPARTAG